MPKLELWHYDMSWVSENGVILSEGFKLPMSVDIKQMRKIKR